MKKPLLFVMGATLFLAPLVSLANVAEARSSCGGLSAAALAERLSADKCSDGIELPTPIAAMPAEAPAQHKDVAVAAPAADDEPGGQNGGGNGGGKKDVAIEAPATKDDLGQQNGGGNGNAGGGKKDVAVAADATDADKGAGKHDEGDNVNYVLPGKGGNQPKKITNDPTEDHFTATQTWLGKGHDHDHSHDSAGHDGGKDASGA